MIKFQNMGLQKNGVFWSNYKITHFKGFCNSKLDFYVMKCFLMDTNTIKYCQNSEFAYCGPDYLYQNMTMIANFQISMVQYSFL